MSKNKTITDTFGHRLRVRVCGICIQNNQLLMVKHDSIGKLTQFWAPPGGGLHYGESTHESLIREFKEETGLDIEVKKFLFTHEFLDKPLHGIELFFEVEITGGKLTKGFDPEIKEQIIQEVSFNSFEEIKKIPIPERHNLFNYCNSLEDLKKMHGLYHFIPEVD